MEHIVEASTVSVAKDRKEVIYHCRSCNDWVSELDSVEVLKEFKESACSGPPQHEGYMGSIECYIGDCPYHEGSQGIPDPEPFCTRNQCIFAKGDRT